jgi:hypothetical protein
LTITLLDKQSYRDEEGAMLAEIYNWFTEEASVLKIPSVRYPC